MGGRKRHICQQRFKSGPSSSNASHQQALESLTGIGTVTQHYVNLWWDPSTGAAGYNVYRSTALAARMSKSIRLSTRTPRTPTAPSSPGRRNYYEAAAVDSSGQESARSTPPVQASIPWSRGFCKTIEAKCP
jgi:hypothetical protein